MAKLTITSQKMHVINHIIILFCDWDSMGGVAIVRGNQCCSCHATPVDGVLPGRSNRQQSPAGPVNIRHNMRRCSLYIVGAAKVYFGWKLGPFIMASVNQSCQKQKDNYSTGGNNWDWWGNNWEGWGNNWEGVFAIMVVDLDRLQSNADGHGTVVKKIS